MLATLRPLTLVAKMDQSRFKPAHILTDIISSSSSELFGQRFCHSWNTRNVDARSVGLCTKPFWIAYIDNPILTRLEFDVFFKELFQGSQVEEAENLATVVWAERLLYGQCWSISLKMEGAWRLLIAFSDKCVPTVYLLLTLFYLSQGLSLS